MRFTESKFQQLHIADLPGNKQTITWRTHNTLTMITNEECYRKSPQSSPHHISSKLIYSALPVAWLLEWSSHSFDWKTNLNKYYVKSKRSNTFSFIHINYNLLNITTPTGSVWCVWGALVPGSAVIELLKESVSQDGAILINKDLFAAIDTDQQTDDVWRPVFGTRLVCGTKRKKQNTCNCILWKTDYWKESNKFIIYFMNLFFGLPYSDLLYLGCNTRLGGKRLISKCVILWVCPPGGRKGPSPKMLI